MKKFLLLILFISLIALWPFFRRGYFESHDGEWMVIRFSAFHQTLTDGQFPVRFVDRLNNNLGYTIENCVSCCAWCNRSKNTHTTKEFYSWITQIYNKMNNIKVKACQ